MRKAFWLLVIGIALVATAGLTITFAQGSLDRNDKIASVVSAYAALISLAMAGASLAMSLHEFAAQRAPKLTVRPAAARITEAELAEAERAIADAARSFWHAEAEDRGLLDPMPIAVGWRSTARPVAAAPASVTGALPGARALRLKLHGDTSDVAAKFRALPQARLVVIGEPGSGKTALTILLVRQMLAILGPGGRIPLVLSLSSWNPREYHIRTWASRVLANDWLSGNLDLAYRLVEQGRVLLVLDGLDEIPEPLRPAAFAALERGINADEPYVLTCRAEEYERSVAARGIALPFAAVVEMEGVSAADCVWYLEQTLPPSIGRDRLLAHLGLDGDGPVSTAFRNPLRISLARFVYGDPARDPAELLDRSRFPSAEDIERTLLDGIIPRAFPDDPRFRQPASRWTQAEVTTVLRSLARLDGTDLTWWTFHRCVPSSVSFIAYGLFGLLVGAPAVFTVDPASVFGPPTIAFATIMAFVGTMSAGPLPINFSFAILSRLRVLLRHVVASCFQGVAIGSVLGLGLGTSGGFAEYVIRYPGFVDWVEQSTGLQAVGAAVLLGVGPNIGLAFIAGVAAFVAGASKSTAAAFRLGLKTAVLVLATFGGAMTVLNLRAAGRAETIAYLPSIRFDTKWESAALAMSFAHWLSADPDRSAVIFRFIEVVPDGVLNGLVLGLFVGVARASFAASATVVDVTSVSNPTELRRTDSRGVLQRAAVVGSTLVAGIVLVNVVNDSALTVPGLLPLLVKALAMSGAAALASVALSATGRYQVALWWLQARCKVTGSLIELLEECHTRGVLRQVGSVYQYRHARLRDRLLQRQ